MPDEVAAPVKPAATATTRASAPGPVVLELVRNALTAAALEMTQTLVRAAYSPGTAEMKDFSVGLFDAGGDAIVQSPGYAADLAPAVRKGAALFEAEGLEPGDVVLSNDPESSAQHVSAVAVFSPIFAGGALAGFAAVR